MLFIMIRPNRCSLAAVAAACALAWGPNTDALAQAPAGTTWAAPAAQGTYTAAQLETLVGPFALYADDLVAIILPASTYPLQVVQADRFLDKRKSNSGLKIDENWDDSVKALVNYPDVVKKMSADLDWTEALGTAVATDNQAVMEAVQAFRRKAQAAGNLKSDAKQVVKVEQQIIVIEPADPTVIYIPNYVPSQVLVVGAPVYPYYVTAYPVYWYPYPPGAALATGIIWGAAMGAIWNGGRYATHYGGGNNNITINRGNTNINTGNINTGNINRGGGGNTAWKPSQSPAQGAGNANRQPARVGDTGPVGGGAGAGAATRPAARPDSAFGGVDAGASAQRASARGQESRSSGGASARASSGGGRAGGGGRR
jgi:hypothetical protein